MEISSVREGLSFYCWLTTKDTDPELKRYLLPIAKTARMEDAEKVYYVCYLCGKRVWVDSSKRITISMTDGEPTKITVEHTLCKRCKRDYLDLEV